jgi:hypothetical protein
MKKTLLALFSICIAVVGSAQCTPDYDFGDAGFGVSPDPVLGESFEIGHVGIPYMDIVHILVPTDAGDVDSAFMDLGAMIDSLALISIQVLVDGNLLALSDIGLEATCNNNGDSPDPCTFMGGEQYCALIDGTPTVAGEFPLQINVEGYLQVFAQTQAIPYTFDQYTLVVDDGTMVVEKTGKVTTMGQNVPNPVMSATQIGFTLNKASSVQFEVRNLLGEVVAQNNIVGRSGENVIKFDASNLQNGLYLYSISANGQTHTKRMVINK